MRNTKNRYSIQVLPSESNKIREMVEDRIRSSILNMIYNLFEEGVVSTVW